MKVFLFLFSFFSIIQAASANPSCHDVITRPIVSHNDAAVLCPQKCGAEQWNGQWDNRNNYSAVCGCCTPQGHHPIPGACNTSNRIDLIQGGFILNQTDAQLKCTTLCLTHNMCWDGNWRNQGYGCVHGDCRSIFICGCNTNS